MGGMGNLTHVRALLDFSDGAGGEFIVEAPTGEWMKIIGGATNIRASALISTNDGWNRAVWGRLNEAVAAGIRLNLIVGLDCSMVGAIDPCIDAIRTRVLRMAAVEAGALNAELFHPHVLEMDRLVSDWHGQKWVELPGHVRATRREGRHAVAVGVRYCTRLRCPGGARSRDCCERLRSH